MFDSFREKFASMLIKGEKSEEKVSYSPIVMTVALCKRKHEEEQMAKYGVKKERSFLMEVDES